MMVLDIDILCIVDRLIEGNEIIDFLLCFCTFELTCMSASRAVHPITFASSAEQGLSVAKDK